MVKWTNLKIQKAKELIKNNVSISKIAKTLGFTESNYFTKVFKKQVGLTPTEYKNKIKNWSEKIASIFKLFQFDTFS